jgi:hypothetical protein
LRGGITESGEKSNFFEPHQALGSNVQRHAFAGDVVDDLAAFRLEHLESSLLVCGATGLKTE